MQQKIRWSKKFDPDKPLRKYLGDEYWMNIKKILKMYTHDWEWPRDRREPRTDKTSFNEEYKTISGIFYAISSYKEDMKKYNFSTTIDWENEVHVQSVYDYLVYELNGVLGYDTNFYENDVFTPYYQLLINLTNEGYDVRLQWKQFKNDMTTLWKNLPDFYRGLGKDSSYYVKQPKNYDPTKPFPQYSIPENI